MSELYRKGRAPHIKTAKQLRRRLVALSVALIVAGVLVGIVLYDLRYNDIDTFPQVSKTTVERITFDGQYHNSDFFQFAEGGNWRLAASESTQNKIIFRKYLGSSDAVQHQLIVYINHKPTPLELTATRVVPVSIENGKSFAAGEVSGHCGKQYGTNEPRRVRTVSLSGTKILCDPDTSQYKVIFGKVGGDYSFKLKRQDGSVANYIIMYQDSRYSPDSLVVKQIAESFMAL